MMTFDQIKILIEDNPVALEELTILEQFLWKRLAELEEAFDDDIKEYEKTVTDLTEQLNKANKKIKAYNKLFTREAIQEITEEIFGNETLD